MKSIVLSLLAPLALFACGASQDQTQAQPGSRAQAQNAASPQQSAPARTAALPDFSTLAQQQGPAVVNIVTSAKPKPAAGAGGSAPGLPPNMPEELYEFFRRFMPDGPPGGLGGDVRRGMGSGFIIDADGLVLTNAHVVAGASEVTVRLADSKREFKAKVLGADERTDVALLKVDATGLPTVKLGDSKSLRPGQWVAAIGSPFGFANTITAGIVSATGRSLPAEAYVPFIQTDVAVNPGNSGGPLINLDGEVVGVNSMIYSGTGGYMGVSFAIPIELAMQIAKELQATGKVTRGRIGVAIQPVTKELAEAFGMKEPQGALIASVEAGGPADKAGVKAGDVVVAFDGKPVADANDLPRLVAATKPGEAAQLEVWRGGERRTLTVTATEFAESKPAAQAATGGGGGGEASGRLGIRVSELPDEERKALGVEFGVVVQSVEKPGVPLRQGDVIVAVNSERFSSVEAFRKLVERHAGEKVALLVRRGEGALFVPVEVG